MRIGDAVASLNRTSKIQIYIPFSQIFDFNLRRDHQKNFLWASRLWVVRRKDPFLGYVRKNYVKKNSCSKGLTERRVYESVRDECRVYESVRDERRVYESVHDERRDYE